MGQGLGDGECGVGAGVGVGVGAGVGVRVRVKRLPGGARGPRCPNYPNRFLRSHCSYAKAWHEGTCEML